MMRLYEIITFSHNKKSRQEAFWNVLDRVKLLNIHASSTYNAFSDEFQGYFSNKGGNFTVSPSEFKELAC